jgi:hypothetical protein
MVATTTGLAVNRREVSTMKQYLVLSAAAVLLAQAVFGESTDTLRPLIETAANATGADYIAAI